MLAHTGCIILRSSQWRHAHRDIFCREPRCIPLRLRCTECPGTFSGAHIHIHIHMAKTFPSVCHPKQLKSAAGEIKRRGGKLSPAGAHTLWSTDKDESKQKACLTEPDCLASLLDDPQRDTGDWSEEDRTSTGTARGRRNLLLLSQMYFWRDKRFQDESRLCWCDHCLSSVMPHDVRRYLDHSLAYTPAASALVVVGWCLSLRAPPWMIA